MINLLPAFENVCLYRAEYLFSLSLLVKVNRCIAMFLLFSEGRQLSELSTCIGFSIRGKTKLPGEHTPLKIDYC